MAAASPNQCSAANALVSEGRTFDAESSDLCRERHRDRRDHACCFARDAPPTAGADRARRSGGFKGHAEAIGEEADQIVCLATPGNLGSVGKYYQRFAQLRDTEVTELLDQAGNFVS